MNRNGIPIGTSVEVKVASTGENKVNHWLWQTIWDKFIFSLYDISLKRF